MTRTAPHDEPVPPAVTREVLGWSELLARVQARATCALGEAELAELPWWTDADGLEEEQSRLAAFARLIEENGTRAFAGSPEMLVRIRGGKSGRPVLDPCELHEAGRAVAAVVGLARFCGRRYGELQVLIPDTEPLLGFMHRVEQSLDSQGTVLDNASPELARLRRALLRARRQIEQTLERMVQGLKRDGIVLEDIVTVRNDRYVIPVVAGRWSADRYILHDRSSSGNTLFVEPVSVLSLNNELAELRLQELAEVQRILLSLNDEMLERKTEILEVLVACGRLDSLQARATFVARDGWHLARVSREGRVILQNAAHPLLKNPVPISLSFTPPIRQVVISGANAGGKTACLKTIGLFALMQQSGLPLPAGLDSELPILADILVDIGDAQSLENDLSTFSAHVVSLSSILQRLERADGDCLVLLDELGVGSNPRQGAALACALLEQLARKNCIALVTTHYEQLIALATRLDTAENCAVRYDIEQNRPLYLLDMGHSGISHSFRIARRYGLPDALIRRAEEFLDGEAGKLEGLMESLERRERALEKERRNLIRQTTKMREEKRKAAAEAEVLKARRDKAREETARELERSLRERLAELDRLVAEARDDAQKMRQSVRRGRVRDLVRESREELRPVEAEEVVSGEPIHGEIGEAILYGPGRLPGRIVAVLGRNRYRVEFASGMIMELEAGRLQAARPEELSADESQVQVRMRPRGSRAALELDLRGKTVEEGLKEVETYLEEVSAAGLTEVRIIHGKGTMRLAEAVNDHLRRHPLVREFRFGKWGEGDYGVTVVSLR